MIEPLFNQMQVQPAIGVDFAARRAHADAAGPGHHHGRRDPRPRHRRHGGAGGADRPPRAVDAAHQRRADRGDAAARPRRAAVPDQLDAARRDGAAAGAHAVPALQEAGRAARRRDVAHDHLAVARREAGAGDGAGGLPRMPDDRLPRPHGPLRDHADDAGAAAARHRARPTIARSASRRTRTA